MTPHEILADSLEMLMLLMGNVQGYMRQFDEPEIQVHAESLDRMADMVQRWRDEILVREVEFQLAAPKGEQGGQVNGAVKSAPPEPQTSDNATDDMEDAPFALALVPLAGMLASALGFLPGAIL
jgi:hypothetical protein